MVNLRVRPDQASDGDSDDHGDDHGERSVAALALVGLAGNDIQRPRVALGRARVARLRRRRRRRSELRRLSASRKFYVAKNAGLAMTDPNYWSLAKVAEKFKLKSPNPVVVLSKHLKARGVNLRSMKNGGQDVQEELGDQREVRDDENEITSGPQSGRVGNSGRKPLTELQVYYLSIVTPDYSSTSGM